MNIVIHAQMITDVIFYQKKKKKRCNNNIIWKQRWICAWRLCNTAITWRFLSVLLDLRVFDLLNQTESADIFFIDFEGNICGTYFEHVKSELRADFY